MKQRLVTDNNGAVVNTESVDVKKEQKPVLRHSRMHFICRHHKKAHRKLIVIASLLLFLFIVTCLLFYFCKSTLPENEKTSVADIEYVLPIGNVTDDYYYITRPNGRGDGGVVRVMFAVVSTRINWMLCYAVASAYFTDIPIVVVGYKKMFYHNLLKPEMFTYAIKQAGLQDSDVVLALDADIMFTGLAYLPFVDKFIKLSPVNLNELDAKAIRTGKAMAPSTYGTEENCYAPQTLSHPSLECHTAYEQVYEKNEKYVNNLTEFVEKPFVNYDDNTLEHLNSGTSIQRVWAMRKLFAAFHKFMSTNRPVVKEAGWGDDQSVFAKLYLELRLWEIEQDYFRKHTEELRTMSNEYGLHAGIMGLDLRGELSVMVHSNVTNKFYEITTEHWQTSKSEEVKSINVFDKDEDAFVQNLYNKTDVKKLFTQRKLTRSYSNVHSVTIAPPLLSIKPRHINGKDKPAERVYPALIHFASASKEPRYKDAFGYMQWSLPMRFDKEEWKRSKQYVMSMPIELWTDTNEKLRLRYGDVCEKYPFNQSQVNVEHLKINKRNFPVFI